MFYTIYNNKKGNLNYSFAEQAREGDNKIKQDIIDAGVNKKSTSELKSEIAERASEGKSDTKETWLDRVELARRNNR